MHDSAAFIVSIGERASTSLCRPAGKVLGILTHPSYHPGMDEKRKRMGAAGWTVVALALLMLYVFGFGPALWALEYADLPDSIRSAIVVVYTPLNSALLHGPKWLRVVFRAYERWWSR